MGPRDDPHAVIVALGANDGLRAIDPAVTRTNLDRLLGILAERGLPVLLAGMVAPPNLGPEYAGRFDPIYPELAARHGAVLYPFLLEGVATVTLLNQEDGIHPNAAGVEEIGRRMLPAVLCLAGRAGHPPDRAMAEAARLAAGGAGSTANERGSERVFRYVGASRMRNGKPHPDPLSHRDPLSRRVAE